jgi:hypothetical protein
VFHELSLTIIRRVTFGWILSVLSRAFLFPLFTAQSVRARRCFAAGWNVGTTVSGKGRRIVIPRDPIKRVDCGHSRLSDEDQRVQVDERGIRNLSKRHIPALSRNNSLFFRNISLLPKMKRLVWIVVE